MTELIPDGTTINTQALQAMIDAAGNSGGGTVRLPVGVILTGGLILRSGVHLQVPAGATLLGSPDANDYPLFDPPPVRSIEDYEGVRSLIYADGCEDISITGPGTIDGNGPAIHEHPSFQGIRGGRPRGLFITGCRDIRIEDLRLRCSGFWMQHYLRCDGVRLHGLDIYNHGSSNNDGVDIDGCRNVVISDCRIDSHDDAICLKSGNATPTEHVVITNCLTRTHCNHFKTGTESNGGFRHITVSNLHMTPSSVTHTGASTEGGDYRGAGGIALGCVDGGMLEDISISHVTMDQTRVPLFIKFGDRRRPVPGAPPLTSLPENARAARISISHVTARGASSRGGYFIGLPDRPIHDVRLSDCLFEFEGGGDPDLADRQISDNRDAYPSCDAFGDLPAFGLYCRDVNQVRLDRVAFRALTPDARPAFRWQRCSDIQLNQVSG